MNIGRINKGQRLGVRSSAFRRSDGILHSQPTEGGTPNRGAFTLVELLVVITIIALIAAVALPRFKGFGAANATISATRQLLDDIALARARAISSRSDVYIVFVPPATALLNDFPTFPDNLATDAAKRQATNLLSGQYTTYALYAGRGVGDQPGRQYPRYLTSWKTLPQGTFIATSKFGNVVSDNVEPFWTNSFPFPNVTDPLAKLRYVAFDSQGRLVNKRDEVLPLARGSIFYPLDANGKIAPPFTADVLENPPGNSRTNNTMWTHVVIDWLTGRARIERQEIE